MHRVTQDYLEELLDGVLPENHQVYAHLKQCIECTDEVEAMRLQNDMLRAWSFNAADVPEGIDIEPRPGFYARVLDRIEAQRPTSIWTLFSESLFGRRLATASLAFALVMAASVFTQETYSSEQASVEMDPLYPSSGIAQAMNAADNGSVLMSLVSYRGQ
jgi:hypothetical protein